MGRTVETVLADAPQLGATERAELAAELIASLDGPADSDAAEAWAAEIERRLASIDAGTATLESWHDVKQRIEREVLGR
ncbi:MAG: addiction module protein [Dehalococcoidia bacterium]